MKLIDFGLATEFDPEFQKRMESQELKIKQKSRSFTCFGLFGSIHNPNCAKDSPDSSILSDDGTPPLPPEHDDYWPMEPISDPLDDSINKGR